MSLCNSSDRASDYESEGSMDSVLPGVPGISKIFSLCYTDEGQFRFHKIIILGSVLAFFYKAYWFILFTGHLNFTSEKTAFSYCDFGGLDIADHTRFCS